MAYEIEGTIKVIMDTLTLGSGFTKRELVITTGADRYPQDIKLEFVKDKVNLLDRFQAGQRVKVDFEIRGSEHNGRYYVNLSGWRIYPADGSPPPVEESRPSFRDNSGGPPRGGGGGGGGGERKSFDRGGNSGGGDRRGGGGFDREKRGGGRNFDDDGGGRRGGRDIEDDIDF